MRIDGVDIGTIDTMTDTGALGVELVTTGGKKLLFSAGERETPCSGCGRSDGTR
jgi:hypothetical protein